MSRILKRPMFRKGGPAMEGVMTGIKDREKFAVKGFTQAQIDELQGGSQAERIRQQAELLGRFAGAPSRQAALTNFLLQFGPAIATRPATGNIFTDVLGAAQAPAANLAKQRAAEDQFQRQLGLVAAKSVIDPKTRKLFVAETEQDQINKERDAILSDKFSPRAKKATDIATKNVQFRSRNPNKTYISNPNLTKGADALSDVPVGGFYYDYNLGNYYKKTAELDEDGRNKLEAVDINGKPLTK